MSKTIDYSISDVRALMTKTLNRFEVEDKFHNVIIDDYLGSQLLGKTSHGISKFLIFDRKLSSETKAPEFIKQDKSLSILNCNGEVGQICAKLCVDKLCDMLTNETIAMVGMNGGRYSRAGAYTEAIAKKGYVAIATNNGGPAAILPHGSIDAMFGTNPISFAFPASPAPLVIDFSTAERVWGEVTQAAAEKRNIPYDAFVDASGNITHDPESVEGVYAMGGHKGAALAMAIEILTGALIGSKMGLDVKNTDDVGTLFIGINPERTIGSLERFKNEVTKMMDDIRQARPTNKNSPVRIPSENPRQLRQEREASGIVPIREDIYQMLVDFSAGKAFDLPS